MVRTSSFWINTVSLEIFHIPLAHLWCNVVRVRITIEDIKECMDQCKHATPLNKGVWYKRPTYWCSLSDVTLQKETLSFVLNGIPWTNVMDNWHTYHTYADDTWSKWTTRYLFEVQVLREERWSNMSGRPNATARGSRSRVAHYGLCTVFRQVEWGQEEHC